MLKSLALACAFLCALTINAEARVRHKPTGMHPDCNRLWPCESPMSVATVKERQRVARGGYIARQLGIGGVNPDRAVRLPKAWPVAYVAPIVQTVSGIVAPLAAKVAEIQAACGSKVVSGVRHTNIAGTRIRSLHASGKAVDLAGNPSCIYSLLHGWTGGYSTDYGRVRHVHLSYDPEGGREMGVRFAHGSHRHARRNARHRLARASQ
jgi:hypothetical protein